MIDTTRMTTNELQQWMAEGPRSYQVTAIHHQFGRLNSRVRLTYRAARVLAQLDNRRARENGEERTYIVEAHATTRQADALPIAVA